MRNKFPGICYRCNEPVKVGKGHFERVPYRDRKQSGLKAKWILQHSDCAIRFRGQPTRWKYDPKKRMEHNPPPDKPTQP